MVASQRYLRSLTVAALCLICALPNTVCSGQASVSTARVTAPDEGLIRKRASDLLKQMTPQEKMGQLNQVFVFGKGASLEKRIEDGELGSVLFLTDPAVINALQHTAVEKSRLHIPLLFGFDVIHGLDTVFPVPLGMAASWNPEIVEKAQAAAAAEARAVGIQWVFAPMVDIARDPRWGRIVEGSGEDPYLGAQMAAAQVRGFQGTYIGAPGHVLATAKHFAGYGAAEGGRDYEAAEIPEEEFRNVYLPPFKSALDAGVGTFMSAYMDLNGVPATGNRWLLHDILRDEWHFNGFVVSDADAVKSLKVHGFAKDTADAAVRAFKAGVNMEMALGATAYSVGLPPALQSGQITNQQLDDAVLPILEAKFRLGLFEHPYVDEGESSHILADPARRILARQSAEQSAVLLRNEGNLLPLAFSSYKKIAVIGPLADSKSDIVGSWVFDKKKDDPVTVLEALRHRATARTDVQFAQGVQIPLRKFTSPFDALVGWKAQTPWSEEQTTAEFAKATQLAQQSDVSIVVLGESQNMSGEYASSSTLDLPGSQEQLLRAVVATGKPVVLVLMSARPLNLNWASSHVPSILDVWYPGSQGGEAIANLLFGDAIPGGKLPITWPRDVGQVPMFYAHNTTQAPEAAGKRYWNEESTPLYPFGYGLSYAKFNYSNLRLSQPTISIAEDVDVSADVENTSDTPGVEVAQFYIHQRYGTSSRPVKELKGFTRIALKPHEKRTVHFNLTKKDREYWSSATRSWVTDASTFDVGIGGDSTVKLTGVLEVIASK